MENALQLLQQVSFFEKLEKKAFEQIAARMTHLKYRPQEALFHQGEPGHAVYFVLKGQIRIQRETRSGETIHLAHRGPGEIIGELALIDDQPRMADAITVSACHLLILNRAEFIHCVETNPKIGLAIMASLAERLRESANRMESHQELGVLGRLSEAILEMVKAHGVTETDGSIRIAARVTQQSLADEIGTTRESVSRALSSLRSVRAIRNEGRTLIVLNLKKLHQQCAL